MELMEKMKTSPNGGKKSEMYFEGGQTRLLQKCIVYKETDASLAGKDQWWIRWWGSSSPKMSQTISQGMYSAVSFESKLYQMP